MFLLLLKLTLVLNDGQSINRSNGRIILSANMTGIAPILIAT